MTSRPDHLAGDAPLALADDVIDGRRDRGDHVRALAFRRDRVKAFRKLLGDEAGRECAGTPARMLHDGREKRNVVADAVDIERVQRLRLGVDRRRARTRMGDELGDHRVVVERDLAAFVDTGVVAHGHAVNLGLGGRPVAGEPADRRQEIAIRILGVDAALHRPAGELHVALLDAEWFAGGNPDHLLDKIDAGDELGDRMLDLEPRVHLQEIKAAVLPGDELDGAGEIVADRLGERDCLLAHAGARCLVEQRRRRLLQDLLIAALDRAFALAEIDDVAVLVAQHLDLDVARIDDELLDEHAIVAERRERFRPRARKTFRDLGA